MFLIAPWCDSMSFRLLIQYSLSLLVRTQYKLHIHHAKLKPYKDITHAFASSSDRSCDSSASISYLWPNYPSFQFHSAFRSSSPTLCSPFHCAHFLNGHRFLVQEALRSSFTKSIDECHLQRILPWSDATQSFTWLLTRMFSLDISPLTSAPIRIEDSAFSLVSLTAPL